MFNLNALTEKKYKILGTSPIRKMSLDERLYNIFAFLENYEKMGFNFIKFPDQLVKLHYKNKFFSSFWRVLFWVFFIR